MIFFSLIHSLFFPSFCVYCRIFLDCEDALCRACIQRIKPVVTSPLKISSSYEVKVFAIGKYEGVLKKLIVSKHYRQRANARLLGGLVWEHTTLKHHTFDVIVPIPLHWTRYAKRWFNQAHEMSKQMSLLSHIPLCHALKRIRKTPFQSGFTKEDRKKNVAGVFETQADIANKHILLVDDVMTTGATVREAVKILKKQRPASITIAVAARVV